MTTELSSASLLAQAQAESEANYDRTVREDIAKFREVAGKVAAGELTQDEFRPHRLRRGVYSQRQMGVHMIRTKIPGGIMTAEQMDVMAEVADRWAAGKGHLTTRQNIQYHFVPLDEVANLLDRLADVRLTTREACYNTVRNVTASPLSGLLPNEVFDVTPHARISSLAFLHKELTDSLPRKFKIAFFAGGQEDDMALGMHDAGLTAVIREVNGEKKRGFKVVIGGGLGPMPNEAALLDEFLPEEHLIPRLEAIIRLFNKHGNRNNKNKARLKFVLRERGFQWVKDTIETEFADILANGGIPTPQHVPENFGGYQSTPPALGNGAELPVLNAADPEYDRWLETNIREQKQAGYAVVTVRTPQGNLTGDQMRGVAKIARQTGDSLVRVTIDQNLQLGFIPLKNMKGVFAALKQIGLAEAGAGEIEDVTSCPGGYSCNLALTKSMNLGNALGQALAGYADKQVRAMHVKVSGCPNSCGQHWLGDIGFYGNARKINGQEVPYYQLMLGGGNDREGMLRYALAIHSIPAKLAPAAARRVIDHFVVNRVAGESFREYVLRHKVAFFKELTLDLAKPAEFTEDMHKDWGDDAGYSLQLGRGECAA